MIIQSTRWTRTRDLMADLWDDAINTPNPIGRFDAQLSLLIAFAATILVGMAIVEWIAEVSV